MTIIRTPIINDDGSCTTGTVNDNAWKQEFYDQIDALTGLWQAVPFVAANFGATGGGWTVAANNILVNRYVVIGQTMIWTVFVDGAAISGAPSTLNFIVPGGYRGRATYDGLIPAAKAQDGAGLQPGIVYMPLTGTQNYVVIQTVNGAPWTPGGSSIGFTITLGVQ